MSRFRPIMRNTNYLFPPSMNDWVAEHHPARLIVEIVEQLDLKAIESAYGTSGSEPFHPALLLSILIYGYSTGVFSSRKLEAATYDSLAFRYIAADEHPDHDTLNSFRKRFLNEFKELTYQVLLIAHDMGIVRLGNLATDGTKIKANASRHSALSFGHINKLEEQLKAEVDDLMKLADEADNEKIPEAMKLPEEIARREDRLKAIGVAKAKIKERAKARYELEKAEYDVKMAVREEKTIQTGKAPRGREPVAPVEGALDKDQINLTDEESRIMKVGNGGFDQCYNAQITVDMGSMMIVTADVVQACNDKQQIENTLNLIR